MFSKKPHFESKFDGSVSSLVEDITNVCKQIHLQQLTLFSESPAKKAAYEALWHQLTTTRIIDKQLNFISLEALLSACRPFIFVHGLSENKHFMLEQVVRVYHALCLHGYFLAGLKDEDTKTPLAKKIADFDIEVNLLRALFLKDPLLQMPNSPSAELFLLFLNNFIELFGVDSLIKIDIDINNQKYIHSRFYKNISHIRNGFEIIAKTKNNDVLAEEGRKLIKEMDILKKNLPEWFQLILVTCKPYRDECLSAFALLEKNESSIQNMLINITQLELEDLKKIGIEAKVVCKKQTKIILSNWDDSGEFIEEALVGIAENIRQLTDRHSGAHQHFASMQNEIREIKLMIYVYRYLNELLVNKDSMLTTCLSALESKRKYLVDFSLNPIQRVDDFFSRKQKKETVKVLKLSDELTDEDWEYLEDDYYSSMPDISPAQAAMLDAHYPDRRFTLWQGASQTMSNVVSWILPSGDNNSGPKTK